MSKVLSIMPTPVRRFQQSLPAHMKNVPIIIKDSTDRAIIKGPALRKALVADAFYRKLAGIKA